jgi:hypothetical protein
VAAPLLSVVLDIEGADVREVRRTVGSVTAQDVDAWEVVLHGAGAETAATEAADPRVRSVSASGSARERVETAVHDVGGEFLTFLTAGDELAAPNVLGLVGDLLDEQPDVDFCYGDELVVDHDREAVEQVRMPAWSPERLLGEAWVSARAIMRSALAREACRGEGLLDPWARDLVLRVSSAARHVARLPEVLVHQLRSQDAATPPPSGEVTVVREHLRRLGVKAEVTEGMVEGTCRVSRAVPDELSVTAVVPTCGERGLARGHRCWFVLEAVRSLLRHAGHDRLEVVVVHTVPIEQPLLGDLLALGDAVRLVPFRGPFCLPEMVNLGALSSASDVLVVMNERLEVASDGFLTELVGPLTDEGVGLTGPALLDQRGALLDAGLALRRCRVEPLFAGGLSSDPGAGGLLTISHECSGLSSGCLALRRETFELVGGLAPRLATAYNVDLSFKLRRLGLRRVWVPTATAQLLGPPSHSLAVPKEERLALRGRWLAPDVDEYAGQGPGIGTGPDPSG